MNFHLITPLWLLLLFLFLLLYLWSHSHIYAGLISNINDNTVSDSTQNDAALIHSSSPSPCTSLHQLLQCSLQNKKAKVTLLEISSQLLTLTDAFSLSPNKRRLHCFVEHVFGENSPSCFGADIGKFVSPVWKSINLLGMLRFRVPFTNSGMISAFSLLNAVPGSNI